MSEQPKMVNFDRPKLERLKAALQKAKRDGQDVFVFDGDEWLAAYAKYAIEYLETKLPKK